MQPTNSAWEFLIVCSDPLVQASVFKAIESGGGIAHCASDTTSALTHVMHHKLDGIFIDTRMEGALNLAGNIRRGGSNRYSVIFACANEEEEVNHLLNAGVNFVIHKPIDPHELETVLENARQMIINERRRYLRHKLALPVVLKAEEKEHQVVTANISRGGMAVHCPERFAAGSAIQYVLKLPQAEPVYGKGEIAWSNGEGITGIRFYLMGEEVKDTLWPWMEQRTA